MKVVIHGLEVIGAEVDSETRCAHYRSERDIIAIKFACCGKWFPCHRCHAEFSGHPAAVWPKDKFDERAILCGGCGQLLSIHEYLACHSTCPHCHRQFNSGCAQHLHYYFG